MPAAGRGSARLRLTLLLTLALLPIGVISVMQGRDMAEQSRAMSERALLAETLRAAAAQREVIRTAQGQARALVPLVRAALTDTTACNALMAHVVEGAAQADFAGFLSRDGRLDCTSDGSRRDLSRSEAFAEIDLFGGARVETVSPPPGGGLIPVPRAILVLEPVYLKPAERGAEEPSRLGTVLLALPRSALVSTDLIPGTDEAPLELTTFNRKGEVLWSSPFPPGAVVGPIEAAWAARLPANMPLEGFIDTPAHAFSAPSGGGGSRAYAVVPVAEGAVMTIGAWAPDTLFADPPGSPLTLALLLPLSMWALSLAVAIIAVNRLMLEPLSALKGRMEAFTRGDRMLPPWRIARAPDEVQALADSFDTMTDRIVRDEMRLEKAVHDQQVLLKEVHHRVKNNLQLIASILNMQIRQHKSPESRAVLRRVQDRVMSLATVHQHLYDSPTLSALRVDTLLREIVNRKVAEAGPLTDEVEISVQMDQVTLYPDQAVPLALLLGEAVTNALSHVGRPAGGAPALSVSLQREAGGDVRLEVVNTGGSKLREDQETRRAGLGMRLMQGFASQLDGTLTSQAGEDSGDSWHITLRFTPAGFDANGDLPEAPGDAAVAPEVRSA